MKTINYKDLRTKQDKKDHFLLINVLPRDEFLKDHIKGSVNIPVDEKDFTKQVEKKAGSKDFEIVIYCNGMDPDATGKDIESTASGRAMEKLTKDGFTNCSVYKGGMNEWHQHRGEMAA